jgi:hypothetical protein
MNTHAPTSQVTKALMEHGAQPTPFIAWNTAYCEAEDTLALLFDKGITIKDIEFVANVI